MSIVDPKFVEFESEEDIVDYLTRGIIPKRKNAKKVFNAIKNPLSEEEAKMKIGSEVIIRDNIIPVNDVDVFERTVKRAYENRVKNRNNMICGASFIAAGLLTRSLLKHNANVKEKRKREKYEREMYRDDMRYRKR